MEEGRSSCQVRRSRPARGGIATVDRAEGYAQSELDIELSKAITPIKTDKRPTICFLCVSNPVLPIRERAASYATPGFLE